MASTHPTGTRPSTVFIDNLSYRYLKILLIVMVAILSHLHVVAAKQQSSLVQLLADPCNARKSIGTISRQARLRHPNVVDITENFNTSLVFSRFTEKYKQRIVVKRVLEAEQKACLRKLPKHLKRKRSLKKTSMKFYKGLLKYAQLIDWTEIREDKAVNDAIMFSRDSMSSNIRALKRNVLTVVCGLSVEIKKVFKPKRSKWSMSECLEESLSVYTNQAVLLYEKLQYFVHSALKALRQNSENITQTQRKKSRRHKKQRQKKRRGQ